MKGYWIRILVLTAALGAALPAFAMPVNCTGNACGGSGSRDYEYSLLAFGERIYEFKVGTEDGNAANYTNILKPSGYSFQILAATEDHGAFSAHGTVGAIGGHCSYVARFWYSSLIGFPPASAVVGFDHPGEPHDVGWYLKAGTLWTGAEDWSAQVGMGSGPVHGPTQPIPEPSGLLALACGLGAVGGMSCRRSGRLS